MKHAKILVAAPISDVKDYCLYEWMQHISKLTYPNFDILLVDNSFQESYINKFKYNFPWINFMHVNPKDARVQDFIAFSQNKIRKYALDNNYEAVMMIECDVFPQLEIIERLRKHQVDIASSFYAWGFGEKRKPLIQLSYEYRDALRKQIVFRNETMDFKDALIFIDGDVKKVFSCGLGCVLINRRVLLQVPFRTDPETEHHADTYFALDSYDRGFSNYCDTNLFSRHQNQSWILQNQMVEKHIF